MLADGGVKCCSEYNIETLCTFVLNAPSLLCYDCIRAVFNYFVILVIFKVK